MTAIVRSEINIKYVYDEMHEACSTCKNQLCQSKPCEVFERGQFQAVSADDSSLFSDDNNAQNTYY